MTHTPTSASDRMQAAREALATYEARHHNGGPGYVLGHIDSDHPEDNWTAKDSIEILADALRALVTPPETDETPGDIARRIVGRLDTSCLDDYSTDALSVSDIETALLEAVHAGIDAAWRSWEPENAPGVLSGTLEDFAARARAVLDIYDAGLARSLSARELREGRMVSLLCEVADWIEGCA